MKILSHFIASILFCLPVYSQIENAVMTADFKEISKFSSRQTGFEGIQSYTSTIVNGSQFFYPNWTTGTIVMLTNELFGKDYLFLFDKVRQELFLKLKDSPFILLADRGQIKSFTLNTDRTHYFIPASLYDPVKNGYFYEVLVNEETGYSLLKSVKTKFVKADNRDIEKIRLGEVYDSFEDEITYYISFNSLAPQPITLKEGNIKKNLAAVKNSVDNYFEQHKENPINESLLIDLVQFVNNQKN